MFNLRGQPLISVTELRNSTQLRCMFDRRGQPLKAEKKTTDPSYKGLCFISEVNPLHWRSTLKSQNKTTEPHPIKVYDPDTLSTKHRNFAEKRKNEGAKSKGTYMLHPSPEREM